jgi:hypothetical protein
MAADHPTTSLNYPNHAAASFRNVHLSQPPIASVLAARRVDYGNPMRQPFASCTQAASGWSNQTWRRSVSQRSGRAGQVRTEQDRALQVRAFGVLAFVLIAFALGSSQQPEGQPARAAVVRVIAPSSLCWSGAFDDRTVDGCGAATIPLEPASFYSANAQKKDDGLAELTLVLMVGNRELDRTTTWAEYGVASVSGGP